jgi:hypothetical protein
MVNGCFFKLFYCKDKASFLKIAKCVLIIKINNNIISVIFITEKKFMKYNISALNIELQSALEEYYTAFEEQWFRENKAYGFEVQDLRLGGLKQRITHARKIISDYLCGKTDKIEELEEGVMNIFCDESLNGKGLDFRNHKYIFSANILTHN